VKHNRLNTLQRQSGRPASAVRNISYRSMDTDTYHICVWTMTPNIVLPSVIFRKVRRSGDFCNLVFIKIFEKTRCNRSTLMDSTPCMEKDAIHHGKGAGRKPVHRNCNAWRQLDAVILLARLSAFGLNVTWASGRKFQFLFPASA
jgi:hypothetical protein